MKTRFCFISVIIAFAFALSGCSSDNGNGPADTQPKVSNIPDQILYGTSDFEPIDLDAYVSDGNHADSQITWRTSGQSELEISISSRVATISKPSQYWTGRETVYFVATDPDNMSDSDAVVFQVLALNSDYFPLSEGDTWYYTTAMQQEIVRTVAGDTTINERQCTIIRENGETSEAWSITETGTTAGFYVHLLTDGTLEYFFDQPLRIPFYMDKEEIYNYNHLVYYYYQGNLEAFNLSGSLRFEDFVTYDQNGLNYSEVAHIYYIDDDYSEYYAPGVGLLDNGDYVLDSAYVGGKWYR
ncbi:MAG: hypothetical protein GF404_02275 [candidate division Zixibacteria bacterium]|nr:hypothetical protein [candidate division Zixibacteria bacterium]